MKKMFTEWRLKRLRRKEAEYNRILQNNKLNHLMMRSYHNRRENVRFKIAKLINGEKN